MNIMFMFAKTPKDKKVFESRIQTPFPILTIATKIKSGDKLTLSVAKLDFS